MRPSQQDQCSLVPQSLYLITGVQATEKYGQIFTGELELCNEDSIVIGGELFLRGNNVLNFPPGFACLQPRFHLSGVFYRGDPQLVQGLILLPFFHRENHWGRM